jgi:type I restriction enzyme M protein
MAQLVDTNEVENRLWKSADTLRSNSNYASNEYFLPVMGLIFLRHAYSRYLSVKEDIEKDLPTRGGKTRELTKEDFSGRGAIYLREHAQFDYLASLPDSEDRAKAIVDAMESIEEDYETLKDELPKTQYQKLDNDVLGQLLRTFNLPELEEASGDVFGRIYEYFLTKFADLAAHDNGEFFTPVSIVQMIVNVIEPDHGTVLDPACGSGGMFVQSAHFIEQMEKDPTSAATFYGLEKNATTIRLGKMNLAVHGLEGNVKEAISYYEDPHGLNGEADFVMANPPFNVDEVDADKIKNDPRLPFGLPGVNKENKVSNANYLWISYFYSYLNEHGRSGFVMSSQASSASGDEQTVRKKLIETGAVDVMMAIRGGFFYTRQVPCELWFLDRDKPEHLQDKVLMLDARNVHRKIDRTTYDFSPEQLQNLTSIVWLYRGETERFLGLVADYLERTVQEAQQVNEPLTDFLEAVDPLLEAMGDFFAEQDDDAEHAEPLAELKDARATLSQDAQDFRWDVAEAEATWKDTGRSNEDLHEAAEALAPLAETSQNMAKQADALYRLATRLEDTCRKEMNASSYDSYNTNTVRDARKALDEARKTATDQLKAVRELHKQAQWLQKRFPKAELADVPGLVKLVDHDELEENNWSLSPGRYVGVAPREEDDDFDFDEAMREIRIDLQGLNEEASELAGIIDENLEELGV